MTRTANSAAASLLEVSRSPNGLVALKAGGVTIGAMLTVLPTWNREQALRFHAEMGVKAFGSQGVGIDFDTMYQALDGVLEPSA